MTKELQNGGLAAPASHQPVQPIVSDSLDYQLWQIIQKASSSRQENAQKEQIVQQLWAEHTSLRKEIRDLKEQQDAIKSKFGKAFDEQGKLLTKQETLEGGQ